MATIFLSMPGGSVRPFSIQKSLQVIRNENLNEMAQLTAPDQRYDEPRTDIDSEAIDVSVNNSWTLYLWANQIDGMNRTS